MALCRSLSENCKKWVLLLPDHSYELNKLIFSAMALFLSYVCHSWVVDNVNQLQLSALIYPPIQHNTVLVLEA